MLDRKTQQIFDVFLNEQIEIYIVGGAVRNFFFKRPIVDVDFAVQCPPDETSKILKKNGIGAVPTGLSHGTVTAVIDGTAFEVTSFRRDVLTDGRHAVTEFGGSLLEDAQRRDFTINAMYLDADLKLIDPLGSWLDLEHCLLRFVGRPEDRVKEDYLRILRFFRFLAQYRLVPHALGYEACRQARDGLKLISAERVGAEMRKWLEGRYAHLATKLAFEAKIMDMVLPQFNAGRYAAWQEYVDENQLTKDWQAESVIASDHIPRDEWRLSNKETRIISSLKTASNTACSPKEMGERFGCSVGFWGMHMRAFQEGKRATRGDLEALKYGSTLKFPVNGNDLRGKGVEGERIGKILRALKQNWRRSDYSLDKESLLEQVVL